MLEIEVLLTERQLTDDFLSGLERHYLPEKFFYWFPLSVKAWLDLCQAGQPYKNFARSYDLVSHHASEIARRCTNGHLELVGLGAGQGDKDLLVLRALGANGRTVCYRPVDSSQALLEMALSRARQARFEARGLKADLEDPATAAALVASAGGPRLYLLLGNSLGIIDPLQFLRSLRSVIRPEDLLVVDGEIYHPLATLQAYDNPTNRRFAFAPLATLGLEEGRDGTLVFEAATDPRLEGLHLVSKHFRAKRALKIPVAGKIIELEEHGKIAMNPSWKYSHAALRAILEETGGFKLIEEYASDDQGFLMLLLGRA